MNTVFLPETMTSKSGPVQVKKCGIQFSVKINACNIAHLEAMFPTLIVLGNVYLVEKNILEMVWNTKSIQHEHIFFSENQVSFTL